MNLYQLLKLFLLFEENGIDLSRFSYVETMVTVVDAFNFFNDFGSADKLVDRY